VGRSHKDVDYAHWLTPLVAALAASPEDSTCSYTSLIPSPCQALGFLLYVELRYQDVNYAYCFTLLIPQSPKLKILCHPHN